MKDNPVILFDGVCNLCNGFVQFVIKYDTHEVFHFSSLQSPKAQEILKKLNIQNDLDTVMVMHKGKVYKQSDAFLFIVKRLKFPINLMVITYIVPRIIRNWVYDRVAKNRYRMFGKQESCMIPTENLKKRFIEY